MVVNPVVVDARPVAGIEKAFIGNGKKKKKKKSSGGIYRTVKDYKKRELERVGKYKKIYMLGDSYVVEFKTKDGKRLIYDNEELWGFRDNKGQDYRFIAKPLKIALKGKIYLYGDHEAKIRNSNRLSDFKMTSYTGYFVSRGPDDFVSELTTKRVEELIQKDKKLLTEYLALNSTQRARMAVDYIIKYNIRQLQKEHRK